MFGIAKQKPFKERKTKTVCFGFCLLDNIIFVKFGEITESEEQASDPSIYPDQQLSESEETAK